MRICEYLPGSVGRIVELHGRYYAENWRFGAFFEAKVASDRDSIFTCNIEGAPSC